ncbi:MAG: FAD-binding oxidoreductase [Sporolactobacillus sp.]|jgi:sarcosine oxidase subunit beta|nr:FAD-binding oxidoreductase [Sporolactobacillus sp.]
MNMLHTEVAILGGGIEGCAVAYYTAKLGYQVTVVERGELACGTSSHCDGNILVIDKEPGFDSQMTYQSQQLIDQLAKTLPLDFEYRRPGSILVCESEEEMSAAEQWVAGQKKVGLPFRMLDRSDLKNESIYLADDLPGGLECASDSTVSPYRLAYALFAGAEQYGARLMTFTTVKAMTYSHKQYTIETDRGMLNADYVVNCAGVWAPAIGSMLDLSIPIKPRKGYILVASRQLPVSPRKVMEFGYLMSKFGKSRHVAEDIKKYGVALVFEPTKSQNFLLGSSREFVGFDAKINWNVVRAIAQRCIRFYPKIADMNMLRVYCGFRPWTKDHFPIISPVKRYPGYFIAAGHEGDGIGLSAITGKTIAEMIAGRPTTIETKKLSFDRFAKEGVGR